MAFDIVIGIQICSIIALIVTLCYLFRRQSGELLHVMIFLCAALMINQTGYLFEMFSREVNTSMQAIRFAYLGKTLALLFIFMFGMTFCGVRINKKITRILTAVHFFIVAAVWTNDYHHAFYSSVDFTQEGIFPHVVLGHGPIYNLFIGLTFAYLIIMVGVCLYNIIRFKEKRTRNRVILMLFCPMISVVALVSWAAGVTGGYDATAAGYLLQVLLLLFALVKYDIASPVDSARENVVEKLQKPVLIVNDIGDIIYSNASYKDMVKALGVAVQRAEIERIKFAQEINQNYVLNGNTYQVEKTSILPKGSYLCHVYVLNDITDMLEAQEKIEQAREAAEIASKAKSSFLANMSHEIRTPINAILGMDTMILRKSADTEIKKYAGDIQSAGKTLLSIINDILDFSKIESGKMELVPVDYDFSNLINDVFNMINMRALEKGLVFELNVASELPCRFHGDDVRLRQILVNLLTNAVKYTPNGKVVLHIYEDKELRKPNDDIRRVRFEVKDTGIGIKPEDIDKLTKEFVRIEESRNRNIEGTGLGINIVVSLLSLMRSKLEISSVYGEGSVFAFTLEMRAVSDELLGEIDERIKNASDKNETYKAEFFIPNARLLVVDDNSMNRTVFRHLLSDMKCVIDEADSGLKCLELVKENKYDLIFMDHMMPVMDGVETFGHMKKLGDYVNAQTPVIILTANAISGVREEYLSEGFSEYLSKPIETKKLEALIERFISNEKKQIVEADLSQTDDAMPETSKLVYIDGVDWNHAIEKLGSEKLVLDSVESFIGMSDVDLNALVDAYGRINETGSPEAYDAFRIRVHSMKSNTATIGADQISGLAKYLEYAARECNTDTINALMPLFETEWRRLKGSLEEAFDFNQTSLENKKGEIKESELLELLSILDKAMNESDIDTADGVVAELSEYIYPDEQAELFEIIKIGVLNIDVGQCMQAVEKWKAHLSDK